ncbi:hypothetical protein [Kutzneria kofuensis]|uniref:hypothetical protein n=1 Tax=Kutzneria kofuensis TaxID=103725 RepID=UPI0031EFCCA6
MNDIAELKRFAVVHARAQNIPDYRDLLDRITTDDGDGPGSWAGEWTRAGRALEDRGELLAACRRYAMARFPYVDGPARQNALDRCVGAFDLWRSDLGHVQRLDVPHRGGPRPVLGQRPVDRQAAATAADHRRHRHRQGAVGAGAGAGPPAGHGRHRHRDARRRREHRRLRRVELADVRLRAGRGGRPGARRPDLRDRAELQRHDDVAPRGGGPPDQGVVTAGAPVSTFFTDHDWHRTLPRVTLDTLAHLVDAPAEVAVEKMRGHALTAEQLASLDIPVHCIVSRRDEIIPDGDIQHLRDNLRHLRTVENDDVHGSPNHVTESRLWTAASVLRMRGGRSVQRFVIEALLRVVRSRGRRP